MHGTPCAVGRRASSRRNLSHTCDPPSYINTHQGSHLLPRVHRRHATTARLFIMTQWNVHAGMNMERGEWAFTMRKTVGKSTPRMTCGRVSGYGPAAGAAACYADQTNTGACAEGTGF
eukprot:1158921-Pelagomonas_calceolata.AAC.15